MATTANQARPARRWNPALVAFGLVLALAGFGGSLLVGRLSPGGSAGGSVDVVVAAHDLQPGTVLAAGDLTTLSEGSSDAPPGAVGKPASAIGKVLQAPLAKGQPVLAGQLATAEGSGLVGLPSGFVAATLPGGELSGVAGYIRAGDYIDVIAVVTPRGGGAANVRTIYSGVHVVRVGVSGAGSQGVASSITVAVSECQAEFLNWFVSNANLRFTLLSHDDFSATTTAPRDTTCPASTTGVTEADVKAHWPGLLG